MSNLQIFEQGVLGKRGCFIINVFTASLIMSSHFSLQINLVIAKFLKLIRIMIC